jgi:hypothetical protein
LCSRLGVIHHLDEEKFVKEHEQLRQNRSHLIFNIQIVMGSMLKMHALMLHEHYCSFSQFCDIFKVVAIIHPIRRFSQIWLYII